MKAYWLILSVLFIQETIALEVLGVVGEVVPAKPYYEKLLMKRSGTSSNVSDIENAQRVNKWSGNYQYDSGLSAGKFQAFKVESETSKNVIQPFCLISNDQRSRDWLVRARDVLSEFSAICYLIKSVSEADLKKLRADFPKIKVFALDPTLIISQFSVPHYPALISSKGVEQ